MLILRESDTGLPDDLPIVASQSYLKSKSKDYGWFVEGNLILPFIIETKLFIRRLVFTHQVIHSNGNVDLELESNFLNEVIKNLKKLKVDFIYQQHPTAVFSTYPRNAIYSKFGTYKIDLSISIDALWINLHSKHRNSVRRAKDTGVEISCDINNLQECYSLITSTMKRNKKLSVSVKELRSYSNNLQQNVSFYIAKRLGKIQGCAVFVWSENGTAYYLYGGTIEQPSPGSMNLLHWNAMIDMKCRGVKYYDFVGARVNPLPGSKYDTIQRFKSRFGASLYVGYIWKYPINKIKYRLFYLLAALNAMLHGAVYHGDIIDEEHRNEPI